MCTEVVTRSVALAETSADAVVAAAPYTAAVRTQVLAVARTLTHRRAAAVQVRAVATAAAVVAVASEAAALAVDSAQVAAPAEALVAEAMEAAEDANAY